jgi:rubrerythrin
MSDKPSYLGLLNAIAVAESRAHTYLSAWLDRTADPAVRQVLATVAAREGEHGMSFAKRINELGYSVREKDDPGFEKRTAIATSDRTDLEKMEALGLDRLDTGTKPDLFDDVFKDHSIDIATGELLGRYIAEERDSARLLRCCYEQLKARPGTLAHGPAVDADRLAAVEAKLDAICIAIEDLRGSNVAPPRKNGNGNGQPARRVRNRSKT